MKGWLRRNGFFLILSVLVLLIPLFTERVMSRQQSSTATQQPTTTPDLLTELRNIDEAPAEATSALDLSDLRDANGKLFPQPVEDHGMLTNGQAVNEDPGTERKSYLYHLDAKAGDHLSFSMIGSPQLQPVLALVDGSTLKALKVTTANKSGVMALLDYDVDKDVSLLLVASYSADEYGKNSGAAFILTYTLFYGLANNGVSVASGFVTLTAAPTATLTPTPAPTNTALPTITPRPTYTLAPKVTATVPSILANGIAVSGDIAADETKNGTLDDNTPFLAYRFEGKAGQHVLITMEASRTLQPSMALAYGNGLDLRRSVRPRAGESKITLTYDITQDGTYYIIATRVGADRGNSTGTFTLKLQVGKTGSVEAALPQIKL